MFHAVSVATVLCVGLMCAVPRSDAQTNSLSSKQERLDRVDSATRERYFEVLEEYRIDIAAQPFNVKLVLESCDFSNDLIGRLAEFGPPWIEEVSTEAETCENAAEERFGDHPEVLLRNQERLYGDEAISNGRKLLAADFTLWSAGQISRLQASLAQAFDMKGDPLAKRYALDALKYDETADVRLIAAHWLIREGDTEQSQLILASPFDSHTEPYYLVEKAKLLADIGARDEVLKLADRIDASSETPYNGAEFVQALLDVNAIDRARAQLAKLSGSPYLAKEAAFRRYMLEYQSGTPSEALTAYNALRDTGFDADPILQYRVSLLSRSIALPWKARDLVGLGAILGLFIGVAALAALIIGCVHYRGLVRRAVGREPVSPFPPWSLINAWYALFIILASSLVAIYFVGPLQFEGQGWNWDELLSNRKQLSAVVVFESAVQVAAALPIVWLALRNGTKFTGRYSIVRACLIGAAIGLAFRLPSLPMLLSSNPNSAITLYTSEMVEAMLSIKNQYGLSVLALITVVAAPLAEELLFRGVLLGSFSRHMSFGWANVLQAAIFASFHFQLAAMPILFLLGIVAGAITRRANGLLPAIVLHAVFNLVFVLFFMKS